MNVRFQNEIFKAFIKLLVVSLHIFKNVYFHLDCHKCMHSERFGDEAQKIPLEKVISQMLNHN